MAVILINIAEDYTDSPGGRYKKEGKYSGEDFRETILIKKYLQAKKNGDKLRVDLDGGYGYATSFLEEAFGGLVRQLKDREILDIIEIKSDDAEYLIDDVQKYIKDELKKINK